MTRHSQLCDGVIKESTKAEVLAEAMGTTRATRSSAQRQWDDAILAYLHVPVFYEDEKRWMPPALPRLCARFSRFGRLGTRRRRSLNDLTARLPEIGAGGDGRTELQKLPK